jgi:hypothetical protein
MQLTRSPRTTPFRRPFFLLLRLVAFLAVTVVVNAATADSSEPDQVTTERPAQAATLKKKKDPGTPEDTATKHIGTEIAGYQDSDNVSVLTPSINAGIDNVSGASLTGSYLVDVVSAASADIVSTASNRWQEVRQAGSLGAQYKPHDFGVGVGGSVSSEPDYLSYGFFATMVKDFDEKNWTLTGGFGYSHDTAGRCGANGNCTPFSVFARDLQRTTFNGGIAWVVDRASLASLTADLVLENGDQSKVYRYIPMFSPAAAALVASAPSGVSASWVNSNRLPERPLEQLPLERHRFALTGRYAHRLDGSTLRLEERFYDDDWALIASTTDGRWIFDLGKRFALWPHARFHVQKAVGFWERAYVSGPGGPNGDAFDLPLYRTGDRELGPLWTIEGGGGIKWYLGSDAEPRKWQLGFTADAIYTAYTDDLYISSRSGYLGALTLEVEW